MSAKLKIRRVTARVFRCPLEQPVTTSFGIMRDRPMTMIEVEDDQGARGWGEAWCNFPAVGAEHRARLVDSVLTPLLLASSFRDPIEAFEYMTARTAVLALQSAEPGPFAQAIAGVDTALWDLSARRAGKPLWKLLNDGGSPNIGVYASGLNPDAPDCLAKAKQAAGYSSFKLKVGFGSERDLANLTELRRTLGPDVGLMVDANQGWSVNQALEMLPKLEEFRLGWLEEPIRADVPWSEWQRLKGASRIPLAGGENISGVADFERAFEAGVLGVVQPDLAKWGGISATLTVARRIRERGLRFCPHYLGGGVGLLASAHLLAAVGGDGLLEIDANANPLRSLIAIDLENVRDGKVTLSAAPGLGAEPDLEVLDEYLVEH
jgi:L-alanine-DL-glutamate epimerase-like enolase superfamily enzyme